jgi:single-stranded DNA-binding protein
VNLSCVCQERALRCARFSLPCPNVAGTAKREVPSTSDVVTFGAMAEAAGDLACGQHVAVSGRLGQREWTSKDGSQHARFEVVADEVEVVHRSDPHE